MAEKKFYSLAESGRILGISRVAVFQKVKKGDLEAVRIGRSWAVPARALAGVLGRTLRESEKQTIDAAVRRVVDEYGEVLKRLGKE
ncbi:MAG: helix-turn-helix domain-containing protein [Candidatus Aminicenantes bacterium]|nr:helix-turn-helix domain-containing protein [Candidatus Aminicenantes bacterium]